MTGVRQGLQKVHLTSVMRTNPDEISSGLVVLPTMLLNSAFALCCELGGDRSRGGWDVIVT